MIAAVLAGNVRNYRQRDCVFQLNHCARQRVACLIGDNAGNAANSRLGRARSYGGQQHENQDRGFISERMHPDCRGACGSPNSVLSRGMLSALT